MHLNIKILDFDRDQNAKLDYGEFSKMWTREVLTFIYESTATYSIEVLQIISADLFILVIN